MIRRFFTLFIFSVFSATAFAGPSSSGNVSSNNLHSSAEVGIVNFGTCLSDSKYGKQEQAAFDNLKNQFTNAIEEADKQLREISVKFEDPEYLDGLSPEAEKELEAKQNSLKDEIMRYQSQYYQVLNQANMKMIHTMGSAIAAASEIIAKEKKLAMVANKELFFFHAPQIDVTSLVIAEMDKAFDEDAKKNENAQISIGSNNPMNNKSSKAASKTVK